jgi:hypothetical protein
VLVDLMNFSFMSVSFSDFFRGYFIHDIIGTDISILFGPKTEAARLTRYLSVVATTGQAQHIMVRILLMF